MGDDAPAERLTFWQRVAQRRFRKAARKAKDEPLTSDDWAAYFTMASSDPAGRAMSRVLRALPSSPRCGICGAPFSGFGARLVRPLGYRPSRPGCRGRRKEARSSPLPGWSSASKALHRASRSSWN